MGASRSSCDGTTIAILRDRESSETIRRAPSLKRGMKIWSTPHGDMGRHVNYNGLVLTWPL
jgi:hypothetical protein